MPFPTYKTAAEIPAGVEDMYEEKDGEWRPKLVVDPPLGANGESALEKSKQKAKDEKKRADDAERERDDLRIKLQARDSDVSEAKLAEIRTAAEAKIAPITVERDTLAAENRKLKLTDRVQALALKHGVMPDRIEDAMILLNSRADLGDEGGIVWKDAKGKVTAQTEEQFFEAHKAEKPWLYAGVNALGSDSQPSNRGVRTSTPSTVARPEVATAF